MNIFVLDRIPSAAAAYHCDKHVIKMTTETAQLLATTHAVLSGRPQLYKPTHVNHPCSKWVRKTHSNYIWTQSLLKQLLTEYDHRYGKLDRFIKARKIALLEPPAQILLGPLTPHVLAMPDECKISHDPVECYRSYYRTHKADFAQWRLGAPDWWKLYTLP